MNISIQQNLEMLNANNQYKINTGNKAKATEKLSSGYRINRAADDAAGLKISEKMRAQIRGLDQGTRNAEDGVSWTQVGDGTLNEVHSILQRMRELTIQSLNDTNTEEDRAACQEEFDQLQSEIDRITSTTQFNAQDIFYEHQSPYYQAKGNVVWNQAQQHAVVDGKNDLVITYRKNASDPPTTATITVPAGQYTTQELVDEIDDALEESGLLGKGFFIEFTEEGTCNINFEGGELIDSVSGGLSYLLYDTYEGGQLGALLGATVFVSDDSLLEISSENNKLEFIVENFDGQSVTIDVEVTPGYYKRDALIDILNNAIDDKLDEENKKDIIHVRAEQYGSCIKLAGTDCIVTGFKGNMFKIDDKDGKVYTSIFYDNVQYGTIKGEVGYFIGGTVIPPEKGNEDLQKFYITDTNNKLTFLANDVKNPVTIEIPPKDGGYTLSEMVTKLNDLFKETLNDSLEDNDLELNATIYPSNGSSSYQGIKITSTVKGKVSQVGLDPSSSAYNTLFVERRYNAIVEKADIERDYVDDRTAHVVSQKAFQPLTIDNKNNQFVLCVDNQNYTITLDDNNGNGSSCNSASDLQTRIQNAIDKHPNLNGKLTVSATASGCMKIEATDNNITNITVSAVSGNNGYKDIFVEEVVTKNADPVTNGSNASLTLDETLPEPVDFTGKDTTLEITVDGRQPSYTITFDVPKPGSAPPDYTYTRQEIQDIINEQIENQTKNVDKTFQNVKADGKPATDRNFKLSGTGTETKESKDYNKTGKMKAIEGVVGQYESNEPAQVTIDQPVDFPFTVDNSCNQLQLSINGVEKSFTLDEGTYRDGAALAGEIQDKIKEAFGTTGYGGATVKVDADGKIVITAGLLTDTNIEMPGASTNISCSTSSSTFLEKIHTVKTPASVTSSVELQPSITLSNETLKFSYKDETGEQSVSVQFNGTYTYTRDAFIAALNAKLPSGVKASLDGAYLKLETTATGADTSISFDSVTGGTAIEAMFGNLVKEAPASATAPQKLTNPIVINDNNDQFQVTVNGQSYTLTLDHLQDGETSYTPAQFVKMLNQKLEGKGLKATLSGNYITYTTTATGANANFSVDWTGTVPESSVKVSITNDGKVKLEPTEKGSSISVTPTDNSVFQKPKISTNYSYPVSVSGHHSNIFAAIDGVDISKPITINEYNNKLTFDYYENGTKHSVSISLPNPATYQEYSDLESVLQTEIDKALSGAATKLKVTVNENGVRIQAQEKGSKYYLANPSGGFYDRVLCSCQQQMATMTPTKVDGKQTETPVYTVGVKDVVNTLTNIRKNINDTLSLDFTCTGMTPSTITLTMQLDDGLYSGEELKKEIQIKLNEQLKANGLKENLIEVEFGGIEHPIINASNEQNALKFKLSDDIRLPGDGEYVIDGVKGNAAFSVFYRTDGELDPAYLGGTKDISNGVTIGPDDTELKFMINDQEYSVGIPQGSYSADGIVDTLTQLFRDNNIPAVAERHGDNLRIVSSKLGDYTIHSVSGGAKYELFFEDEWNYDPQYDVKIQVSGNTYDYVEIKKPVLNTCFLRINTIAISKPKYAEKALKRLDYAINRISELRSEYGTMSNRLEHIISNNENAAENTQQAESRIRDADMAKEVMNQTKYSILEQAAQAMMAQAKQSKENVVRLLEV